MTYIQEWSERLLIPNYQDGLKKIHINSRRYNAKQTLELDVPYDIFFPSGIVVDGAFSNRFVRRWLWMKLWSVEAWTAWAWSFYENSHVIYPVPLLLSESRPESSHWHILLTFAQFWWFQRVVNVEGLQMASLGISEDFWPKLWLMIGDIRWDPSSWWDSDKLVTVTVTCHNIDPKLMKTEVLCNCCHSLVPLAYQTTIPISQHMPSAHSTTNHNILIHQRNTSITIL